MLPAQLLMEVPRAGLSEAGGTLIRMRDAGHFASTYPNLAAGLMAASRFIQALADENPTDENQRFARDLVWFIRTTLESRGCSEASAPPVRSSADGRA